MLNKPISTIVDNMIHNKPIISGTSDLSRVAFCAIVDHAVKEVCVEENVRKAFQATGVLPFDPTVIDLSKFPTSLADLPKPSDTPVKATCSSCRSADVELHPLVKQGIIPKRLAEVFTYTPPPNKTKSKSKIVKAARIVTSEEVKKDIAEVESRKRSKTPRIALSEPSEKAGPSGKQKKSKPSEKAGPPGKQGKKQEADTLQSESTKSCSNYEDEKLCCMDDADDSSDDDVDIKMSLDEGDYVIVQYAGKKNIVYYAAVITAVKGEDMYEMMFFHRNGKKSFLLEEEDTDEIGEECVFRKLSPPREEWKTDRVYYYFSYGTYGIELQ